MRYKDIITERELNEGPLDWIKQKASQAADWAAGKLGYAPKADEPAPQPKLKADLIPSDDSDLPSAPTPEPKGRMARQQALQRQRVAQARQQGRQDSASGKLANVLLPGEPAGSSGGQKSRPLQTTGGSTTPSDVRRSQVDKRIAKARARQAGYQGGAASGTSTNTF